MRVHIISDVFPPEAVTSAGIAGDIAEEMTRRGHDTTVFAPFPNRPSGVIRQGYHRSWRKTEQRNGYRIIYSWHTLSKRSTILSRAAENISFGITSTLQLLKEPVPHVVYMNTWPIFAQWMNTHVLHRLQVPVVCVVKDLYPETVLSTGRIAVSSSRIGRVALAIDKQVYKQSSLVLALNEMMADYIVATRGVHTNKMRVVHDWVDASGFPRNKAKNGCFRAKHRLSSDLFIAMYVGSMTRMAGLDLYVDAAERLRHRKDILMLLIGEGAGREEVEAAIRQKKLDNIKMIYPLNPKDVSDVQAAADVLVLSLLPGAAEHATPSKLIFYMFSQRPILASVKRASPPARIIRDAKCGYVIEQGDSLALARCLGQMADSRSSLGRLGENARHYAEDNFLKESILPRVCDIMEQVGRERGVSTYDSV